MLKIIVTAVALTILVLADGSVLQTGQVKSYDVDGNIVTDGSVKDDGYYRTGVSHSYDRSGNVVIDNVTGLEWEDSEIIKKPWLTHDNYNNGFFLDTSGDTATTYCANIPHLIGKEEWRLPSIEELQTLADYSQYETSIVKGIFNYLPPSNFFEYWSATTYAHNFGDAWYMEFSFGGLHTTYKGEDYDVHVRCVRGGQWVLLDLSRDGVTEIVTDNALGLQWQDNAIVETEKRDWVDAVNYCENTLTLGGHSDWRLPNQNEWLYSH